jgi:uncharacterized protein
MLLTSRQVKSRLLIVLCCSGIYLTNAMEGPIAKRRKIEKQQALRDIQPGESISLFNRLPFVKRMEIEQQALRDIQSRKSISSFDTLSFVAKRRTIEVQQENNPISFFESLPLELKVHIINFLKSAKNEKEAVKNTKALSLASKGFYEIINDPQILGDLILEISKQFDKSAIDVAIEFNNPGAIQWLRKYLRKHYQKKELLNLRLLEAAEKNNRSHLIFAINAGADINTQDNDGQTPLYLAANKDYKGIVELLLQYGASANQAGYKSYTPLWWAALYGYTDIVKLLIKHGADVNVRDKYGDTPLSWATAHDHKTIVKLLLDSGADALQPNKRGTISPFLVHSKDIGLSQPW